MTKDIAACWEHHFPEHDITIRQLRLLPYVHHVLLNRMQMDGAKVNDEERSILRVWTDEGHIFTTPKGLRVTKHFWDAMNDVLWLAYANE